MDNTKTRAARADAAAVAAAADLAKFAVANAAAEAVRAVAAAAAVAAKTVADAAASALQQFPNIQADIHELRAEQRAGFIDMSARMAAFTRELNAHATDDLKANDLTNVRLLPIENLQKTVRWLVGVVIVAICGSAAGWLFTQGQAIFGK